MTVDGLARAVQDDNASAMMTTATGMMVSTAVMASAVMVVVVMMLTVLTVHSSSTVAVGSIRSPLAATVGVVEQRILMRLRIGVQIVVDLRLQLRNG